MTARKLSDLPAATSFDPADLIEIVQGGVSKQATGTEVAGMLTADTARLVPHGVAPRYPRPTTAPVAIWAGSVTPDNFEDGDAIIRPAQLINELWYASFNAESLIGVVDDGDPVDLLDDISGNDRDAVQATGAKQPTFVAASGSTPAHVSFGGAHALAVSFGEVIAQPCSIVFAARFDSLPGSGNNWAIDGDANNQVSIGVSAGPVFTVNAGNAATHGPTTPATGQWYIGNLYLSAGASVYRINGVEDSSFSPGTQELTGLTFGARYTQTQETAFMAGDLGECHVKAGALNDQAALETLLAAKYGITLP